MHEPTDECAGKHCYIHGVDEPAAGAYQVCMECRHAFRTAAELVDKYTAITGETIEPEDIYFCPLCIADF